MREVVFISLLLTGVFPLTTEAQYDGPAVESCRGYAKRQLMRDANTAKDVVFDRDQSLVIERYTRKVGSQFVASILTGNGAVVFAGAPSAELSFICLLADEKRPVFFEWLPRRDASAMAQCMRDASTREKPRACLETLLQISETDLTQAYATRLQEARERDVAANDEAATTLNRDSNLAWLQYRDAECERRKSLAPKDVDPDDYRLACIVELTRRRLVDMR
jgi:uncharacterized protein YecT (DUF1311 family)